MAMVEALRSTLMFVAIVCLIFFAVIAAEYAFMVFLMIVDELKSRWEWHKERKRHNKL